MTTEREGKITIVQESFNGLYYVYLDKVQICYGYWFLFNARRFARKIKKKLNNYDGQYWFKEELK